VRDPEGTLVAMLNASSSEADLYYLFDGLGSIAATTDASGNLVKCYSYEPYGQEIPPVSSDANPWRYASGYFDKSTGMLKFGTRYYMLDVMRWTQRDPVFAQHSDPMSHDPYLYVQDDPTNSTDPIGKFLVPLLVGAAALVGTAVIADQLEASPEVTGAVSGCAGAAAGLAFTGPLAAATGCVVGGSAGFLTVELTD
jgi:RHS repeat-associated protein